MNNTRDLLDKFLGPLQDAAAGGNAATGQSLGGGLDAVKNAAGQVDLQSLLSGRSGMVAAAAAGGLAGLLLGGKKPRKLAGSALKLGGIALVGGLAYKAWQDWQANKAPEPAPSPADAPLALPSPDGTAFAPDSAADENDLSRDLIRAMIAAAKADGHIDNEERARIASQLDAVGLSDEQKAFVAEELAKPLDVSAVAASGTTPKKAAEVYAASLLAIDPDGPAERGYLAMLAARLNLDPQLVAHLHANTKAVVG